MRRISLAKIIALLSLFCALLFISRPVFSLENDTGNNIDARASAYREEGIKFQSNGDLNGAATLFQKAILIDPDYVVAYNDLGIIYEANGNIEQAKEMYLKAIDIAPDYPNSYSYLALLYESQGNIAGAIPYWIKRVVVGTQGDPWVVTAKEHLDNIASGDPQVFNQMSKQGTSASSSGGVTVYPNLKTREPSSITLFKEEENNPENIAYDNKKGALEHLERARGSFSRGEYVAALKEATVAEYLDSTNKEIAAFIEQVNENLLHN